uniref:RNA exonuclease 1 homolog-like domain-containing protein n=1 Tax=Mola mola TaxID=94237 RepID=A0A3Q3WZ12_MOLML
MFPSSGLFALLDCPLSKRGACERPYCLYRHAAEIRDKSGSTLKPCSVTSHNVCLQELERINREIESVRHEVEQEQRRLSHYQTAQANGQNTASVSKSETEGRLVDRDSRGLSTDSKKTCYQRKKYMVDNSKPRTDLEYDPLSNFSADLCSYSSSGKEQKVKTDQGLASHSSITSKIQQVQQKASALTASIQGAQTFVSSSSQKRPDARSAPAPSAQTLQPQMQLAPVQNGELLLVVVDEIIWVQPVPTKRKLKHQNEATKDKVPHDVRQRYVNMFTEEFLKTTANVNDAFQKALAEERTVYNRSVNKLKYMSVAVNALKKLKNHTALAAKANSQQFRGNIPLNLNKCKGNDDVALYESLKDYILTEEKLIESNYPFQHPEKSGCAILFADNKKGSADCEYISFKGQPDAVHT